MHRLVLTLLLVGAAFAQPQLPKCDSPEFRQFDFWIGEWTVDSGGKPVGQSRIERLLDGCLILENWYGLDGDRGKSLNWYDRRDGKWRQAYVGVHWNVDYAGAFHDGAMHFEGNPHLRLTFTPQSGGAVRQHKQKQKPNGTWATVYDFTYHPGKVTQAEPGKTRCTNPEARQFDFWAGEWDVFGPKGKQVGQSRIVPAVGGCVLIENWTGAGGGTGKSFNFYDPSRKQWRQIWVSAAGWLNLAGEWRDGAIRYTGETPGSKGITLERLTFTPSPDGTVHQFWEQSNDAGATWGVAFDGKYVRKSAQ